MWQALIIKIMFHTLQLFTYICFALSLYHNNCDSTRIRRYHDALDYDVNDRNYDLRSISAIRLEHNYDEKLARLFFARVKSRRMEAGARDTS